MMFQSRWEEEYFLSSSIVNICLNCKESVATPKEYNLKRHYNSCHKIYSSFGSVERKNEFNKLKASLEFQQNIFHRA